MRTLVLSALSAFLLVAPAAFAGLPFGVDAADIPDAGAVRNWSFMPTTAVPAENLPHIPLACDDNRLVPTHPQQEMKTYHVTALASYDHFRVPADSRVCRVASRGAKRVCLNTDTIEHAVISDTYADRCGNLYRGVWKVTFLRQDDTMGTLFSKGRVLYQNPRSEFANDMYVGGTYAVTADEFLFLTPLFPGDAERLAASRARALQSTHVLDEATGLFKVK